jgi:hypothetical protein
MLVDWFFSKVDWDEVGMFVNALAVQAVWLALAVLGVTVAVGLFGRIWIFEGDVKVANQGDRLRPTAEPPSGTAAAE